MTTHVLIDMAPDADGLARLREFPGVSVDVLEEPAEREREVPPQRLAQAEALLCSCLPVNHSVMARLRLVQISSAGYAQLVPHDLPLRGVRACNALGVFDAPIAEWNVAMLVNLGRDLRGMIRNQEHGIWERAARFQTEQRGKIVGLWGYGGIGRETARLCKAMGLRVRVLVRGGVKQRTDIYRVPGTGDPEGTLPDEVFTTERKMQFLTGLDSLILCVPLTKATEGMVGEEELRALPSHACLLNPARGPLVKEAALLRALREGWIAGAALDTHYHYPMPADHPLWRFPNVIMTPHVSGSSLSQHYPRRVWDIFVQNVERLIGGRPLLNELTPAQLRGE